MSIPEAGADILDTRDIEKHIQDLIDTYGDPEDIPGEIDDKKDGLADLKKELEDLRDAYANSNPDEVDMGSLLAQEEALEGQIESLEEEISNLRDRLEENTVEYNELEMWREVKDDLDGCGFSDGLTLIHEGYFERWAQDFADSTGAINRNAAWPCNHIDWEAAAAELQHDYSQVEIDGNTYYYQG